MLNEIFVGTGMQVKTTQPRRYLVRPNQGIIANGTTEEVQILLVEKDKNALYQSFLRLGQAALDNCKDKFLVQSITLQPSDSIAPGDYDALTEFWTKLGSNLNDPSVPNINNKKLTVVHRGVAADRADGTKKINPEGAVGSSAETEFDQLKKKYDELVTFSVNLTAERDVLNNTLEQTKRDLNRYMAKSAANETATGATGDKSLSSPSKKYGFSFIFLMLVAIMSWLAGCYMQMHGQTSFLQSIPVFGERFDVPESTESHLLAKELEHIHFIQ